MGMLDDIQLWSFQGQTAACRAGSTSEWEEWFEADTTLSIEPILDTNDRYVDIGGKQVGPIQKRFAFPTREARAAFEALRGQTGTLSRPGRSCSAILRRVNSLGSNHNGIWYLDCTFEAL